MRHISFSQLKNWAKCPFYHKLANIDKVAGAFSGNIYTAFGSALHEAIENHLEENVVDEHLQEFFEEAFVKEHNLLEESDKRFDEFRIQGMSLVEEYKEELDNYFGEYEIVKCEEEIYEDVATFEQAPFKFKGFIDLVVKTGDTYHILDWKSTSWGWDAKRRSDTMVVYQLILYKYFYALKHNIPPENIKCHFGLLKRTAKKNRVEIFEVTSGKRRTENAVKLMNQALHNINKKVYLKNRSSCQYCEFKHTEHCP